MPHESVWACRYKLLSFLLIANLGNEASILNSVPLSSGFLFWASFFLAQATYRYMYVHVASSLRTICEPSLRHSSITETSKHQSILLNAQPANAPFSTHLPLTEPSFIRSTAVPLPCPDPSLVCACAVPPTHLCHRHRLVASI